MSIKTNKLVSSSGDYEVPVGKISQFGMGQTWQAAELTDTGAVFTDGTPKYRAAGVTYTNDRDYPIKFLIVAGLNNGEDVEVFVDGDLVSESTVNTSSGNSICLETTIPKDSTYRFETTSNGTVKVKELR